MEQRNNIMTLHGPAEADHYRIKVGRARHYHDPLPSDETWEATDWSGPSVSATKPPFANKYVPLKTIAQMGDNEWARLAQQPAIDRYEAVKVEDKRVGRINMERGTIVHKWAEHLVAGQQIPDMNIGYDPAAWEQAERFRPALESFFDTYQPEPVAVECVCLHRELNGSGYGGTADLFARIDGDTWAVDWKSRNSDHGCYLEEAAQGGAYIGAQYMIAERDGQPCRVPVPDVAGVLIVSLTDDSFKAYPIGRDGAIDAYQAMHAWWQAQQDVRTNKVIGRPWAPRKAELLDLYVEVGEPADRTNLRARIELLMMAHGDTALRNAWPAGVPPLSQEGHTTDDLERILAAVRNVEAAVGAPFHDDDMAHTPTPRKPAPTPPQPPQLDEGGTATQFHIETLKTEFAALNEEQGAQIVTLVQQANEAGNPISVAVNPTVRRSSIARALLHWVKQDTNIDNLYTQVVDIATPDQISDPDQTCGGLIGTYTIEQADRLAERFNPEPTTEKSNKS